MHLKAGQYFQLYSFRLYNNYDASIIRTSPFAINLKQMMHSVFTDFFLSCWWYCDHVFSIKWKILKLSIDSWALTNFQELGRCIFFC